MMPNFIRLAVVAALALVPAAAAAQAPAGKPVIPQVCTNCHQPQAGSVQGNFENVAFKSQAIQLKIDAHTEIVRFDPKALKVVESGSAKAVDSLRDLERGKEVRIEFVERDGQKLATLVSIKGPIKIAPEKLVSYEDVERLVAQGPEAGRYTLIDSRPLPRVQEGTIPTSINLPYPAFDKFVDRLPKEKDRLTIFFCQGVTCMMSPNSLKKAEALGYTNLRVYREGYPEWLERNVGVVSPLHLKEAWIDKAIPHVLVDARPAATAAAGHIPGAVSIPPSKVREAMAAMPDPKLKAPIIVYDVDGSNAAKQVARVIKASGQPNVVIVTGGIDAWKSAKYAVAAGTPGTRIAYTPKPRPGSLTIEEFVKLASDAPPDVLILDVRNPDEANAGMIKGAKLIPDEELGARLAEVPKDKRIVTHCSTGVRAEMAYHKLKDAGFKVAFLNANLEVKKNGEFKVTPK